MVCPLAKLERDSHGRHGRPHGGYHRILQPMAEPVGMATALLLGRNSPCVDQGYHTLVSPSWPSEPLKSSTTFDCLPDNVVLHIMSWLDSSTLCVCARVCRRWNALAWEPALWQTVELRGEAVSGDRAVRGILRRLSGVGASSRIQRVLLSDGARISDRGLTQLARRCPSLVHLRLHGCAQVSDTALAEIAARCSNLQHLDLTGCLGVTTLSVAVAPSRRLLLQYLDLTDCEAVNDGGLRVIVRNCPQLQYLYLRRCVRITGESAAAAACCPKTEHPPVSIPFTATGLGNTLFSEH